jgi:magnesium transporter
MITAYIAKEGMDVQEVDIKEPRCWIKMVKPTKDEILTVHKETGALTEFLEAPMDDEERPRIDIEDDQTLILINIPVVEEEESPDNVRYDTIPLGIIYLEDRVITVCLEDVDIITDFVNKRMKSFSTGKKTRFTLQIMYKTAIYYLKYLKKIDRRSLELENSLHGALKNEQLIKLLSMEKSLVYFTTSLKSNELVMKKILRTKCIPLYEEDEDLLEDVLTENKQAIDMSEINSNILSGMMDAFASIISNNLNIVMKVLTSITIILTIPTMIASFYGMNVALPMQGHPFGFYFIVAFSLLVTVGTVFGMMKKGLF